MTYTEIKTRGDRLYYYRVRTVREGSSTSKIRRYMGADLGKVELRKQERLADKELLVLKYLLTKKQLLLLSKIKREYVNQPAATRRNRYEAFCSLFSHSSTAIEGNTLTLQQTADLLFEGRAPAKSLREIHEVLNHKKAFDFILKTKKQLSKDFVCSLHRIVVRKTLNKNLSNQIGIYRTHPVFIRGASFVPAEPRFIGTEMKGLFAWYTKNKKKLHPVVLAAYFHAAFEGIHPFIDGNGRVGRLILNYMLHAHGYPMVNIPDSKKSVYYRTLSMAQTKGNLKPFVRFLIGLLKDQKLRF